MTYKTRVDEFWKWFSASADRFFQVIEAGKCADLEPEFTAKVSNLFEGMAWVFGPGEDGAGHSFTLSGDGNLSRQFLTAFWKESAPELPGWTFYSSRQPSDVSANHAIKFGPLEFGAGEIMIDATVNREDEKIDIKAWHPNFASCDEEQQFMVLFIWLDEALGETGTQSWIGQVDITPELSPKSVPVAELKRLVDNVAKACEWEKLPPNETYSVYQLPEPDDKFPRSDTISGTTCNFDLVAKYLNSEGKMEDVLDGTGAEFLFLAIDPRIFPDGNEVETRGKIEDTLDDLLRSNFAGRVFGGAFGLSAAYIDLIIFDGQQSMQLIEQAMEQLNLQDRFQVIPFANAK